MWITPLMLLQSIPRSNAMVTKSMRWIHVSFTNSSKLDFVHAQGTVHGTG